MLSFVFSRYNFHLIITTLDFDYNVQWTINMKSDSCRTFCFSYKMVIESIAQVTNNVALIKLQVNIVRVKF